MSWPNALLAGFVGTLLLTTLEAGAQQLRLTRMSLPYLLGTMVTPSREKAKLVGFGLHLVNGEILAFVYLLLFHAVGRATAVLGGIFGLVHSAVLLLVLIPLFPAVHPRMSSPSSGPTELRPLEPPGPFALNYGFSTPAAVVLAHVLFGAVLGALCHFR